MTETATPEAGAAAMTATGSSRRSRLRRASEYSVVVKQGARYGQERVILYVRPGVAGVRAGFVTGRRVGTAVARNRARRLLKEAWRAVEPRVIAEHDVVLVALPGIRGATTTMLVPELAAALASAGILSEEHEE